ncbi:unnamed protein product [Amaranthus hypochondriacus]
MELIEEDFSSFTTKGRRTKRHRSILSISAADSCNPGGAGGGGSNMSYISSSSSYEHDDHDDDDHDHDVLSEVTTEEEDMANCLILLAQGIHRDGKQQSIPIKKNAIKESVRQSNNPYECKTCGKTFSSFQALGGHRTSHKKIKLPPPDHRDAVVINDHKHDHDHHDHTRIIINNSRVHECSICGSEFPSGQALGGHMRRHRATTNHGRLISSSTTPDYDPTVVIATSGPRNILSLDLNLPAPDDDQDYQQLQEESDDHMETTKFVHVLPLVDCYY